jgi:ADP-heptose:LPS heptosyltransferase
MTQPIEPRVLAVCTGGGSGDLLSATPAMQALARNFERKLAVLASPASAPLLQGHPAVETVLVDDGREPIDDLAMRIKTLNYTHAVVFWSTARVAAIVYRAGIPIRVGQSRRLYSWRYTIRIPVRSEHGDRSSQWSDVQMDYVRALGVQPVPQDYRIVIPMDADDRAQAEALIRRVAPGGRYVVFHAARGMRLDGVQWPVNNFAAIGDALGEAFEAPVLLTGSADEAPIIARIGAGMHAPHAVVAGETTMRGLVALLARADVVVALDSGPMHIAAAVGAPTVGIFALRTDLPARWRPLGDRVVVVDPSYPCPPWCRKETCKTFACYRALGPGVIVAAARAAAQMTASVA